MRCIWEGTLIKLIDTVQLLRILDCVLSWALRSFRPWLLGNLESSYKLAKADEAVQDSLPSKSNITESKSLATPAEKRASNIQGKNENGKTEDRAKALKCRSIRGLAFDGLTLNGRQDIRSNTKDQNSVSPSDVPASSGLFGGVSPYGGFGPTGFGSASSTPPRNNIGNSSHTNPFQISSPRKGSSLFGGTGFCRSSESISLFGQPSNRSHSGSGFFAGAASCGSFSGVGSSSSNHSRSPFFGSSLTPGETATRRSASTGADTSQKTFRSRDTSAPPAKRQNDIKSASTSTNIASSNGRYKESSSSVSRNTNTSRCTSSHRGKKHQDEDQVSGEESSEESSDSEKPSKRSATTFDLGYNYRCRE